MKKDNNRHGSDATGFAASGFGTVNKLFEEERFHANRGHGFAAERANDLYDKLTGHFSSVVGDDNAKNGADRMVNGVLYQTKYYSSASGSVNACFENGGAGRYKYMTQFGFAMKVEVPADQYDHAVEVMRDKIARGQVPGVTNPAKAKSLVVKGHFTYDQAKNIAKAGNIDSLMYDATTGVIIGTAAGGISAILTYLKAKSEGEDAEEAKKEALKSGLKIGGTSAATTVIAGQLSKSGLSSALKGGSDLIAKAMGSGASATVTNAFRSGANLSGAAAIKSCSKLIRGNMITGIATVGVLSAGDAVKFAKHEITGVEFAENTINRSAQVAAGSAGFIAGQALIPIPVVGGLIGSFVAGTLAGKATECVIEKRRN